MRIVPITIQGAVPRGGCGSRRGFGERLLQCTLDPGRRLQIEAAARFLLI
jgi:hypothetical protein